MTLQSCPLLTRALTLCPALPYPASPCGAPAPRPLQGSNRLNRLMSDLMFTYTSEQHVATEDSDAAPAIEVSKTLKGRLLKAVEDSQGRLQTTSAAGLPDLCALAAQLQSCDCPLPPLRRWLPPRRGAPPAA